MPEVETPGRPVIVKYECPECDDGVMESTGAVVSGHEMEYKHQCNECGHETTRDTYYPKKTIRPVPGTSLDKEHAEALTRLIADQKKEITRLREQRKALRSALSDIHTTLVCIGGPLNDSVIGYSEEQRKPLHEIEERARQGLNTSGLEPNPNV